MRYHKWEPLQLSSEINSGRRVVKQSVSFDLFRTYSRKVSWTPLAYNNFGIFYGNLKKQKVEIIEAMVKKSNKFHKNVNIPLYTFSKDENTSIWEDLEQKYSSFFHHQFEEDFGLFLQEINNFNQIIRDKAQAERVIEPVDKVLHMVLLDIDEEELRLLNLPGNKELFMNMLTDFYYQRIYVGLFIKNAESLSEEFHKALDFSGYLGNENDDYVRSLYDTAGENEYSRQQILIGTGYSKNSHQLLNLHPLVFTPNKEYLEAQQKFIDEDKAYMKFLNSLDDGSIGEEE